MNSFRHTVVDRGDHVLLTLSGDLDLAAYSALSAQVTTLLGVGHSVVVDCGDVDFLDSMGLNALIEGLRISQESGLAFELARPSAAVLRVLELSGTVGLFSVREGVEGEVGG